MKLGVAQAAQLGQLVTPPESAEQFVIISSGILSVGAELVGQGSYGKRSDRPSPVADFASTKEFTQPVPSSPVTDEW